jgi:hypothetical protein
VGGVHADQQKTTSIDGAGIKSQHSPQQSVGGVGAVLSAEMSQTSHKKAF